LTHAIGILGNITEPSTLESASEIGEIAKIEIYKRDPIDMITKVLRNISNTEVANQ